MTMPIAEQRAKLVDVLVTADNGCSNCVADIGQKMEDAFPGEGWADAVSARYYELHPLPVRDPDAPPLRMEDVESGLKAAFVGPIQRALSEGRPLFLEVTEGTDGR